MPFDVKTISVGRLFLDAENPRHEPVAAPRDAVRALIATERQKLVVLASDIVEHGLSPIDRLLVLKKGRNYTVVEGNRRLAAIKLLTNPKLADGTVIESAIKRVAQNSSAPAKVECAVASSREDAEHWMELRHGGEAEGAGVVRWNALAANRFSHKPGSQAAKAIGFLEAVETGYPGNDTIRDLSMRIAEKRLTTLGRLVADPSFRSRVGMVEEQGAFAFHFAPDALQDFLEHVLGDIAADLSVSQLKSKAQRTEYLDATPKPAPSKRMSEPAALSESPSPGTSKPRKPKSRQAKPPKPFKALDLDNLGQKMQALRREFLSLDVDKVPNAGAILTRAILELAVDEFIGRKSLPTDQKLRKRLQTCLRKVDATGKDTRFKYVKTGLSDGTSLFAVATLHEFVHNPNYYADGTTVRSIAAGLQPFIQALNDEV